MKTFKDFTILVADDEEMLRKTIVFDFKRKGFQVLEADSGNSAFELVKKNKIDLVISDIRMPDGDGISLLEKVRAYNPGLPTVIFMTGFSDLTEAECIAKGAQAVLSKPFDRKQMMQSVLIALGLSTGVAS